MNIDAAVERSRARDVDEEHRTVDTPPAPKPLAVRILNIDPDQWGEDLAEIVLPPPSAAAHTRWQLDLASWAKLMSSNFDEVPLIVRDMLAAVEAYLEQEVPGC